jgi:hypothetical protein
MAGNDQPLGRDASPPCMASEIAPDYFDPLGVDPEQARDVARWRRARADAFACRAPGAERRGARRRGGRVVRPSAGASPTTLRRHAGPPVLGLLADQGRARPAPPHGRPASGGCTGRAAAGRGQTSPARLPPLDARDAHGAGRLEYSRPAPRGRGGDAGCGACPARGLGSRRLSARLRRRLFRPNARRSVAAPFHHRYRPAGCRVRDHLPAAARHPPRRDRH